METNMDFKESHACACDLERACQSRHERRDGSMQKLPRSIQPPRLDRRAVNWMASIDDDTPVCMLTIPGTHDSAAYTVSFPFVRTQKMDFVQQLNVGIRYFDLRCGLRDDIVEMVHGVTWLGLTLEAVLETMYLWLKTNPSEALIVQIKRDRDAQRSAVDFHKAISSVLAKRPERWRTENTMPLLGHLRGRIQLFRRFEGTGLRNYGLNVTEWKDNPRQPFTIETRNGVRVTVQDHYTFLRPQPLPEVIQRKGGVVLRLLKRASSDRDENQWFINFTSAFEINLRYQITPREIAVGSYHYFQWEDGMNVRLRASLLEMGNKKKRLGIIAMDFPELGPDDLIPALIQSNFDIKDGGPKHVTTGWLLLLAVLFLFAISIVAWWSSDAFDERLPPWRICLGTSLQKSLTGQHHPSTGELHHFLAED